MHIITISKYHKVIIQSYERYIIHPNTMSLISLNPLRALCLVTCRQKHPFKLIMSKEACLIKNGPTHIHQKGHIKRDT